MNSQTPESRYYIGWDVGGWNCDKNGKSRDAIVILDSALAIVGKPWRGNLREAINRADAAADCVDALFGLCRAETPQGAVNITLGIDTPLGFSDKFIRLITGLEPTGQLGDSDTNPYLYRQTEHFLFEHGLRPLSAVKDMIGSQATKGMHVLGKFAPQVVSCGVWSDGAGFTAIEAYPSACKDSAIMKELRSRYVPLGHEDKDDALTCALLAWLYSTRPEALASPPDSVSSREGWIWVPRDALK